MTDISEAASALSKRGTIVRRAQLLLVLIGLLVAGYLSYLKIEDASAVCVETGPFNCNVVLNSQYSELAGLPIAYLGFAVYLAIGAILLLENRVAFLRVPGVRWLRLALVSSPGYFRCGWSMCNSPCCRRSAPGASATRPTSPFYSP